MPMLIETVPIKKENSPDLALAEELNRRAPGRKVPAGRPTC